MQVIKGANSLACFSDAQDGDLSLYLLSDEKAAELWDSLPVVKEYELSRPVYVNQIHGDEIFVVSTNESEFCSGKADSVISSIPDLPIGVFSADCVPVLFWHPSAVAATHAGWRSTYLDISGKTVEKLASEFNISPAEINVAIGPCINFCCFELGDEVYEQFIAMDSNYAKFFERRKKWHLDIASLNRYQLIRSGIKEDKIEISGKCTFCEKDEYFSFRRQKRRNGSMFSFVVRRSENY